MTLILATNIIESAFSPLISIFQEILVFIHNSVLGGSWGLAIVGLTVVVRAVMVPLTVKQFHSMQRLQQHMPRMKEIQEKYKDDKQRQQQELMKFYQENKINPFASCLPLVLQLPVFISLFYMLRVDLKKHICGESLVSHYNATHSPAVANAAHLPAKYLEKTTCEQVAPHSAKFLFIPDITNHASGVVLVVLILLYVSSQLGSTMLMSATVDKNQRRMMMLLPLVFVLFVFKFPAGLLVYWITTNMWTVVQQYIIRRRVGPPPVAGGDLAPKGKPERTLEPAMAAVSSSGAAPPPPPRKRKKRSGRRR
ncbi:MAG TPA: YidC/Oxa1 family membrane protein insertase [Solirubrobacteraceae bacterium]|jgi:YidC/Oxa1 family membrane protein insertase|nr:YidC/Oxa1 family membrane protein insertase [Solirubrobacteraceae bacterium]